MAHGIYIYIVHGTWTGFTAGVDGVTFYSSSSLVLETAAGDHDRVPITNYTVYTCSNSWSAGFPLHFGDFFSSEFDDCGNYTNERCRTERKPTQRCQC